MLHLIVWFILRGMSSILKKLIIYLIRTIQSIGRPSVYLITTLIFGISQVIKKTETFVHILSRIYKKILKLRVKKSKKIKQKKIKHYSLIKNFIAYKIKTYKKLKKLFKHKKATKSKRKTKKYKIFKLRKYLLSIYVLIFVIFISLAGFFYVYIIRDLPSIKLLTDSPPSLSTKILDRNGKLLYQIYKDENRSLVKLDDLPKYVIDATLAAEDKNFYHHFGVDLTGIIRAAINNIRCSAYSVPCSLQGGSTITQQLVKNTLLTPEKTFTRKIKELILSFETEFTYSKDQILEMYLNQVSYGGTAYGIEEASRQYFGKSARELTLSESAMLTGLPISPTTLSPFGANPYLSKIRQEQVLASMVQTGAITELDKGIALSNPLVFHPQGITIRAPHFVMYIKDLLVKKYGEDTVARGGLIVKTTLDLEKQEILQKEINDELLKLVKLNVQNGAGLIIDPKSGGILAMVGSKDFFDSTNDGQVNIVTQPRQPGSSIKPITYTLALSSGLTPYSIIDDIPTCFRSKGQPDYCPKNYDGRFHGKVTLKTALGSSYNIPATKLLNTYGIANMIELAKHMGITTWDDSSRFGLSLTLGGGEITMLDLASVYSVFANNGQKIPFNAILSVVDPRGSDLIGSTQPADSMAGRSDPIGVEVISPAVAYQINSMLSDPLARAPSFGMHSILNLPGKNVAVKTGTTNNLRDNWTFGYTSELLVATWVGNNNNSSMSSVASGITGASPIWARTMQKILNGATPSPFLPPDNMIKIDLSCNNIPKYEYFIKGNIPRKNCSATPSGTLLNSAASTSQ